MAFWSKKDAKTQDIQALKDKIGAPRPPYPQMGAPTPQPFTGGMPPLPPPAPMTREPVDEAVSHALRASEMAPLFVKIDRYKEILQKLEEIKVSLRSTTDVMVLLNEVEHIRDSTVKALRQAVTDLTDALIALDSEFIRPEEVEVTIPRSVERTRVQSYVSDLQTELATLKKELQRMK